MAQGGLGEVEGAEVLELGGIVVLGAETGDEQGVTVGHALVGEVVDGVDGRRAVQRTRPFDGVDVDGDERRLPVVSVDHVGHEPDGLRELEGAAGEQREPLQVVAVGLARRSVQVRTIEVPMVLEEVHGHVAARQPPEPHSGPGHAPPHRHVERAFEPLERVPVDPCVEGHHHPDVDAAQAERLGERPDDVAEAAGLRERRRLRGHEQDLERARRLRHPDHEA